MGTTTRLILLTISSNTLDLFILKKIKTIFRWASWTYNSHTKYFCIRSEVLPMLQFLIGSRLTNLEFLKLCALLLLLLVVVVFVISKRNGFELFIV